MDSNNEQKEDFTLVERTIKKLAQDNLFFCNSDDKQAYIAVQKKGRTVLPIQSEDFRTWLMGWHLQEYGKILRRSIVEEIVQNACAIAQYINKQTHKLGVRVSRVDDDNANPKELYYDLGDAAVHITRDDGWKIIDDSPIVFKRFSHQEKQVYPEVTSRKSDIELLHKYINIKSKNDWLLFLTFVISAFIPDFPKPLLLLVGAPGAGKSTLMKLTKQLVDPSLIDGIGQIRNCESIIRPASKHALLYFDNISYVNQDISDTLCGVATGTSLVNRKMYTDSEEVIYKVQRSVMLNGVTEILSREDILDRSIPVSVQRIDGDERLNENKLMNKFNLDKPLILGAIFSILVDTLRIYPNINLKEYPRMADFAALGFGVAEAMTGYSGDEFIKAYDAVEDRQVATALNASPTAQAARFLVSKTGSWQGTATDFLNFTFNDGRVATADDLNIIQSIREQPTWCRNVSALGKSLNRAEATLKSLGIVLERGSDGSPIYRNGQRWITLTDVSWQNKANNSDSETSNLGAETITKENKENK